MEHHFELSPEGLQRLYAGHPWLYKRHIKKTHPNLASHLAENFLVPLGEHWFFYDPTTEPCLRRLGPATRNWPSPQLARNVIFDLATFELVFFNYLENHFFARLQFKKTLMEAEHCFRWIFSEADLCPGLVVDCFDKTWVVQILNNSTHFFWPILKKALLKAAARFFAVNDREFRIIEKTPGMAESPVFSGESEEILKWNGLKWHMKPGGSQKTGSYFDQRDNHRKTIEWVDRLGLTGKPLIAWDLCSFEGGFGLHLAREQFRVLAVDQSQNALETANRNAKLNSIDPSHYTTQQADVFEFLRSKFDKKEKADVIVLDPPAFAKGKKEVPQALRGYKELNLRAFHCLQNGGLLVSCTCSHNIHEAAFLEMLLRAAHDARRSAQILEISGPSPDHAGILSAPESFYLRAFFITVF